MGATIKTDINYTYDGQLAEEILIKPAVENPDIRTIFQIETGINYKKQLHRVNPMGKLIKAAQGCGPKSVTGQAQNITNRELETCQMEVYMEQCYDEFEATLFYEATRAGISRADLRGTTLEIVVRQLISEAIQRDMFRILSFNDSSSGINDYYNFCNGLWPTLLDNVSTYDVTAVNDSITALGDPSSSSGDRAVDYFKALFEDSPIILKQLPPSSKVFFVTGNVYENYLSYLEEKQQTGGGFLDIVRLGMQVLSYRGIPVIPVYAWDSWISADAPITPNTLILYTDITNHRFGFDDANAIDDLEIYYDRSDDFVKSKAKFRMGYNYVFGDLQAISYGSVS